MSANNSLVAVVVVVVWRYGDMMVGGLVCWWSGGLVVWFSSKSISIDALQYLS